MINKIFYKHYVFLEELNPLLKKNLLKFKNLYIIINIDQNDKKSLEKQNSIVQFAKKNRIPFLFKNSFQNLLPRNRRFSYYTLSMQRFKVYIFIQ